MVFVNFNINFLEIHNHIKPRQMHQPIIAVNPFWFLATLIFLITSSCNSSDKQIIVNAETEFQLNNYPDDPYEIVYQFCENVSAFSHIEEQPYSNNAASFLSTSQLLSMEPYSGSMASKITQFAGFEKTPNHGFHIMGVIEITEDQAWVETRWNFAENENHEIMIKTFYLIKEDDLWKIEKIL
jgi:hypothetical protein